MLLKAWKGRPVDQIWLSGLPYLLHVRIDPPPAPEEGDDRSGSGGVQAPLGALLPTSLRRFPDQDESSDVRPRRLRENSLEHVPLELAPRVPEAEAELDGGGLAG